jgi:hypothetical protein
VSIQIDFGILRTGFTLFSKEIIFRRSIGKI